MTLNISPISAFKDNYIWLFQVGAEKQVGIVDPGDAGPVLESLANQGLQLNTILITHHHPDHTGGIEQLLEAFPDANVIGSHSSRIGSLKQRCKQGDTVRVLGLDFEVIEIPGHTLDHIAFYLPSCGALEQGAVFCGDTLFAAGCGRIFEGEAAMMHASLAKLEALPGSTLVYCAHEYTLANLNFALAAEPENADLHARLEATQAMRAANRPSIPSSIALEQRTNPFLRCHTKDLVEMVATHSGKQARNEIDTFAQLRAWKDNF